MLLNGPKLSLKVISYQYLRGSSIQEEKKNRYASQVPNEIWMVQG